MTAFGFWTECDIGFGGPNAILVSVDRKRPLTLSFPLLLAAHCTCAGEKDVKRAQDSHAFEMGALE